MLLNTLIVLKTLCPNIQTINVQNYFQLISSYKIPMQKEKNINSNPCIIKSRTTN